MGFRLCGATQPRSPRPISRDPRQQGERRLAGSLPHRVLLVWSPTLRRRLRTGFVASGPSRGRGRRSARPGPVVRCFQCAMLCELGQYGADRLGLFDAHHDPQRSAAVNAGGHIDVEHAPEALRPAHLTPAFGGRAVVFSRRGRCRINGRPPAAPGGRQLRAQVGVRGKDAVQAREMRARRRNQRGELGDEVHRLELDVRGAR